MVSCLSEPRLLRGHVAGRADDCAGVREIAVAFDALGQAEVGDVRRAVGVEQDVAGLEVAVQDAALVGVVDGASDGDQS